MKCTFACEILRGLHLHQSRAAYLPSCGSVTGSHICPVCGCPLSTGLWAFSLLYSIFFILHPSIQQALVEHRVLVYILLLFVGPGQGH